MRLFAYLLSLALMLPAMGAMTAPLPDRTVRVIVPFPPGGSSDFVTRVVVEAASPLLPRGAVVENRSGGNGAVGMREVARGPADGSILAHCFLGHCAIVPNIYPDLGYDMLRDFAPVALVGSAMNLMTVHRDVPAATVAEFVALAKSRPGAVSYASSGIGSTTHLAAAVFAQRVGIELLHVPYRGGGQAITDHIAGRVQVFINPTAVMLPHLRSGALRALAVTGAARDSAVPDVPTMAEAGIPGLVIAPWYGFVAPAATPPETVAALNAVFNRALEQPQARARLIEAGVTLEPGTAAAFGALLAREIARWGEVVRANDIRPE
jgi:tripartite-type tricarboxylate transporter receptor subunit TctC